MMTERKDAKWLEELESDWQSGQEELQADSYSIVWAG